MSAALMVFLACLTMTSAGGMISLTGQLEKQCNEYECRIRMGRQLYILNTTKLSQSQKASLKAKKAGDAVSESVPLNTIKEVKDLKSSL